MIRNLTKVAILITVAAAFGGCTTTVVREGTSVEEANRDIAECRYEANKSSPDNALIAHDLAKQCLALRGYTRQ